MKSVITLYANLNKQCPKKKGGVFISFMLEPGRDSVTAWGYLSDNSASTI